MSKQQFVIKGSENVVELNLDDAIDQIKALQEAKRELDNRIKAIKAPVKDELKRRGADVYENPNGVTARFKHTQRTNADRKVARAILSDEDYNAIFVPKDVVSFEVK